eukprot:403366952
MEQQSYQEENKLNFNNISDDDLVDNPYLSPDQKAQYLKQAQQKTSKDTTPSAMQNQPQNNPQTQPQNQDSQKQLADLKPSKQKEKQTKEKQAPVELPKEQEKQMKNYCQLCFQEFNLFTFRQHCRTCGRSCCSNCSTKITTQGTGKLGIGQSYRICEFCEIKNENPQIEDYYKLECSLRQSDQEIVVEKIKWLKKTSKDLEKQIGHEREDISLLQASSKRQIDEVQNKITGLHKEKARLDKLKEQLMKNIEELSMENKHKDVKIKELQSLRTSKLIDLDKIKTKIDGKEKELKELIKEISKYDDNFKSFLKSEIDRSEMNITLENEIVYQDLPNTQTMIMDDSINNIIDNSFNHQPQEDIRGAHSKTQIMK